MNPSIAPIQAQCGDPTTSILQLQGLQNEFARALQGGQTPPRKRNRDNVYTTPESTVAKRVRVYRTLFDIPDGVKIQTEESHNNGHPTIPIERKIGFDQCLGEEESSNPLFESFKEQTGGSNKDYLYSLIRNGYLLSKMTPQKRKYHRAKKKAWDENWEESPDHS